MFDKVIQPNLNVQQAIEIIRCNTQRPSEHIKHLLNPQVIQDLINDEESYCASGAQFYKLKEKDVVNHLSNQDAVSIYNGKFRDNCKDVLLKESEFQRCPVCGGGYRLTLDHVLPKSKFTQFALTPINIVPLCRNCNSEKGSYVGFDYSSSSFNPYFEDFSNLEGVILGVSFTENGHHLKPIIIFSKNIDPKLRSLLHLYKMDWHLKTGIAKKVSQIVIDTNVIEKAISLKQLKTMLSNLITQQREKIWQDFYRTLLSKSDELAKYVEFNRVSNLTS